MSLIPYTPTSYCIYNNYDYVEWLPNIVWTNPVYAIILSYFIGMYAGIFLSIEYINKYNYIMYGLMDSDTESDNTERDNTDNTYNTNDDDDDEDYTEEDLKEDEDEDEKQEEDDDTEFTKMEIRDAIDTLYIKTGEWDNFVSTKSIYLRLQNLFPSITKFMVKEAMNIKPKYVTGTQYNIKGYRFITAI